LTLLKNSVSAHRMVLSTVCNNTNLTSNSRAWTAADWHIPCIYVLSQTTVSTFNNSTYCTAS